MKILKQILHLAGAITFIGAYLTADSESWRLIHVYLGYGFGVIFTLRLIIGLVPKTSMALQTIWMRANLFKTIVQDLKDLKLERLFKWQIWYGSGMGILVFLMYFLSIPLVLFGIVTYEEFGGKWFIKFAENTHEFIGEFYLSIVLIHLVLVFGKYLLLKTKNQFLTHAN
ncbi:MULTISPECIES: cytochrome b/b6 domain-containing protein [unclassified Polynucleobacter]|uniref:cytochrome b/b6 domain-containing protein n=1 Tax=unclassified Polynucleobacter TaxID=2640945 RepID=UPI002573F38C|nr:MULTISPECIES: cytochrome b/b6 domain-containing protein [unclassified Polynucleobacter]BEI42952.1 hypothetical protein PHIN10_11010 [Polynucleobacter sp. HIN10]BEI44706.1 hypothetical protein PHIN11_10780 [Polynucleobacter sp. HIN11]